MLIKIKTIITKYAKSLTDVRVLGQSLFIIIVLLVSWSGVKAIQKNYELQKQISKQRQELEIKKLENENLKFNNQYLATDQFLELSARRQFGKGAPGETLLIVPKDVALKNTVTINRAEGSEQTKDKKPFYQENIQAWMDFFFRGGENRLIDE